MNKGITIEFKKSWNKKPAELRTGNFVILTDGSSNIDNYGKQHCIVDKHIKNRVFVIAEIDPIGSFPESVFILNGKRRNDLKVVQIGAPYLTLYTHSDFVEVVSIDELFDAMLQKYKLTITVSRKEDE